MPDQMIFPIVMHLQRDLVLQACANKFGALDKEVKNATTNADKIVALYKDAIDAEAKSVGTLGKILTGFSPKSTKVIPEVTKETAEADLEDIYAATLEQRPPQNCPWPWVKVATRKQFAEDYFHHVRTADIGLQFMKNCSYISEITGAHEPGTYVDIPDVHFQFLLAEYNRLVKLQREQYPTEIKTDTPQLLQESK